MAVPMRCCWILLVGSVLPLSSLAFTSISPSHPKCTARHMTTDDSNASRRDFIRLIGAASVCGFGSSAASAMDGSSSVMLSDAIKTMDMGLPSYGSISSTKPSAQALQSLTSDYQAPPVGTSTTSSRKSSNSEEQSNPMGAVLPSMNKSVKKSPRTASSSSSSTPPPVKESKPEAPKFEVVDMSLPSYSESTSGKKKNTFAL